MLRIPVTGLFFALSLLLAACGSADLPNIAPAAGGPLYVSKKPDRSGATDLANAQLKGKVYIFAKLDGLSRATFYLDDKTRSRKPYRTEWGAPFDLLGGAVRSARPFDTATLKDGPHTLTVALTLAGRRTQVVHASFTVRNAVAVPTPTPPTDLSSTLLSLVNDARRSGYDCRSAGVFAAAAPLTLEPRLTKAAQGHADDMNVNTYFSHTGKDGSTLGTRVTRTGYSWWGLGENIALGYPDAAAVMAGWLGSDGHCANIMNPSFTQLGVGKSGSYWVQVFARPQ